ncbi:MAG: hypothetical protein JJE17_13675 [Peptostreptococcaceae bacterium]|nr:hypothetical protein [Peptostreptococcaceae bacterium]
MNKSTKFLIAGFAIILLSSPLGLKSAQISSGNLTTEFVPYMAGFIISYILVGFLLCCRGFIEILKGEMQ